MVLGLCAFVGVRPEVVGHQNARDGLVLGDLPDVIVDLDPKTVRFRQLPVQVLVRRNLSKVKRKYFSFAPTSYASSLEITWSSVLREARSSTIAPRWCDLNLDSSVWAEDQRLPVRPS